MLRIPRNKAEKGKSSFFPLITYFTKRRIKRSTFCCSFKHVDFKTISSMDNSISIVNKLHLLTKFIEAGQFDESDRKSRKYIGLMIKDLADCVLKSVATTPTPTTPINSATYTNPSLIGAPLPPPPPYPGPHALVTSNILLRTASPRQTVPPPPDNDEQGLIGFGLRTHDENGATVISENNHNMFGRSRRQCRNCGLIVRLIIPANFPFTLTFKFIQIPLGHSSRSIKRVAE